MESLQTTAWKTLILGRGTQLAGIWFKIPQEYYNTLWLNRSGLAMQRTLLISGSVAWQDQDKTRTANQITSTHS